MKLSAFLATLLLTQPLLARTWTEEASGRKIEAEFVSADATKVTVSVRAGSTFTIDLARLSAADRAFVQEKLQSTPATPAKGTATAAAKSEDRFKDIHIKEVPAAGDAHPALATVDAAVQDFMISKGIGAATFALSKNGTIVHDRAFGWADADLKTPLQPGVRMRVASMTKPVVQAAIKTLFTTGKLKADDLVFPLLNLAEYKEAKGCDTRWQKVTVQHLLDHKGGWDREVSRDFTFSTDIAETFKVEPNELTPMHMVRYGLLRKLDFEPGERYAYCNYGYTLLARIIEKVSGQKLMDYLHATVCEEAKTPSFSLSSTDARDRQSGEIWYCYHPEYPSKAVPLPFRTEAPDGAGILACTAADYCRFLQFYSVLGDLRRAGGSYRGSFSGSHAGVTAICAQRTDGINYAIICNRRGTGGRGEWNDELRTAVDAALEKVAAEVK